jgi:hypothetical protein
MDQWLVRTALNWVAGPYSKEQVRQMILERKLTLQDEVCPANGYWIFLHERDEVKAQLGVDVPRPLGEPGEDVTETQTALPEDSTDPDLSNQLQKLRQLEALANQSTETTAVLNTNLLKQKSNPSPVPATTPAQTAPTSVSFGGEGCAPKRRSSQPTLRVVSMPPQLEVMGQKESSRTKGMVLLVLLALGGAVYWVFKK